MTAEKRPASLRLDRVRPDELRELLPKIRRASGGFDPFAVELSYRGRVAGIDGGARVRLLNGWRLAQSAWMYFLKLAPKEPLQWWGLRLPIGVKPGHRVRVVGIDGMIGAADMSFPR